MIYLAIVLPLEAMGIVVSLALSRMAARGDGDEVSNYVSTGEPE